MYDEEGYDPYDAYYTQAAEDAYLGMLDDVAKAATPNYTFVAPHGPMCYQEYLAYCKYQCSLEDQCFDLPF